VTAAPKVSTCIDCSTTIIGGRLRCPACHDQYAIELTSKSLDDNAETGLVPRSPNHGMGDLIQRIVALEVVGIAVLVLIIAARGCLS
jgi:hypothetical protein